MAVIDHARPSFKDKTSDYAIVETAIKEYADRVCVLAYALCQIKSLTERLAAIDDMRGREMINSGTAGLLYAAFMGLE